jgi:hypothetical protein
VGTKPNISGITTIETGVHGITARLFAAQHHPGPYAAGDVTSNLHEDGESPELKAALDAVESLVVGHAMAGIDIKSPAYLEGIETAVDSISNHFD